MYKATSKHMQDQALGAAQRSRKNGSGLDASALATERSSLVARKRVLEADCAELSARIQRAKALAFHKKNFTDPKTYQRWTFEKIAKTREINAIEEQIMALKEAARDHYAATQWTSDQYDAFNKAFHNMAKQMLADDVYERIRVAALHAYSEPQTRAD